MNKTIIISIVAILMPLLASAYDAKINGFYFNLNQSEMTAEVTMPDNQSDYSGEMSIPAEVIYNGNTYSVTSIGDCAFSCCSALTSILIPNSVTRIGEFAFELCSALTSISIPNSVTYIGKEALNSTGYYKNQPNGVVYLDNCAIGLKGNITDLTFKAGTRLIASGAFYNIEDLISVIIPGSVVSLGDDAFADNYNLTSVTIQDGVEIIGKGAFSNCWALTTISIGYGVTSIGRNAFYQCFALTSISIPNSVTSIGENAFYDCNNLASITMPSSVSVGDDAFNGTEWYNNQPDGLMYFGDVAYRYKGTMPENTNIEIKEGTTALLANVFSGCSGLTSISIPNSVKSIGGGAFWRCNNLTSITIPDDVSRIEDNTFSYCSSLTSVNIPSGVTSIGYNAFSECNSLTSVHITDLSAWCKIDFNGNGSNPLEYAHHLFLNGTEIKDLVFPDDITSIVARLFSGCSGLTSVTIPNNMTSISQDAFDYCSGLTSVIFHCQQIGSWFSGLTGVNTVTIGDEVTSIGDNAFKNCSGLASITIPEGVTSIGNNAFSGCSSLASVTLHCQQVGSWFSGLSSISDLTIGDDVTSINENAFKNCSGLTSVTIGSSVTNIGSEVFSGCNNLGSVTVRAENPPVAQQNTFPKYTMELKVPENAAQTYMETEPWSNFTTIKTLAGTEVQKKKCAMPIITVSDDRLYYVSETEGVTYHVVVTAPQSMNYYTGSNSWQFTKKITISVSASKTGWEDSDTATLELDDLKVIGDANMDGKVDAADLVTTANIIMGKE